MADVKTSVQATYGSASKLGDTEFDRFNLQIGRLSAADPTGPAELGYIGGITVSNIAASHRQPTLGLYAGLKLRFNWAAKYPPSDFMNQIEPLVLFFDGGLTINGGSATYSETTWGPFISGGLQLFSLPEGPGLVCGIDWHANQYTVAFLGINAVGVLK